MSDEPQEPPTDIDRMIGRCIAFFHEEAERLLAMRVTDAAG
jgi:hypothetical protein